VIVRGLLLAVGAGTRMGTPKALVADEDGAWLPRGALTLLDGGCDTVVVVLGASSEQARSLVPAGVDVVVADDWAEGMSASLLRGLRALEPTGADVAVVHLVDLPDVGPRVVRRLLDDGAPHPGPATEALARASYAGVPGHPVLLGRDHWAPVAGSVVGDQGAREYLRAHDTVLVECGDLASGRDVDSRE
jgi:CTP:molybdopterin cytidylyltransferase MocA